MKPSRILSTALLLIGLGSADAAVLLPADVSVWLRKSANGVGNGNELNMIDPTKSSAPNANPMNRPDVNDPTTWTVNYQWMADWQGPNNAVGGSKVLTGNAWIILDLGSSRSDLDEMFIWNVSEATGWNRGVQDFNVHYGTSPSNLPTGWAGSGNLYSTATEHDFGAAGWSQLGSTVKLDKGSNQTQSGTTNGGAAYYDGRIDVSSITARYVGIEILSNWGDTNGRAGLNNVTFTTAPIPEPSSALLIGLGGLGLVLRRRR